MLIQYEMLNVHESPKLVGYAGSFFLNFIICQGRPGVKEKFPPIGTPILTHYFLSLI